MLFSIGPVPLPRCATTSGRTQPAAATAGAPGPVTASVKALAATATRVVGLMRISQWSRRYELNVSKALNRSPCTAISAASCARAAGQSSRQPLR